MAKQAGPFYFIGTIDDITFYKQGGEYYIKRTSTCSETTKKKYKTEPGYALLRLRKNQFGSASKLVQEIYYTHLPKAVRKHKLFGNLTGIVNTWLQQGKTTEEALQLLVAHCAKLVAAAAMSVTVANEEATETPVVQKMGYEDLKTQKVTKEKFPKERRRRGEGNGVQITRVVNTTNKRKRKSQEASRNISEWLVHEKGKLVRETVTQPTGMSILDRGGVRIGYCDPCWYTGLLDSVNVRST